MNITINSCNNTLYNDHSTITVKANSKLKYYNQEFNGPCFLKSYQFNDFTFYYDSREENYFNKLKSIVKNYYCKDLIIEIYNILLSNLTEQEEINKINLIIMEN